MGETRLAVEVGLHVAPAWESGVWMVELAEVVDPELIAEEVASMLAMWATAGVASSTTQA
ncbi:MAG: putative ATPase [Acidimicrobiales bacterium]|jgi:predicted ATPase